MPQVWCCKSILSTQEDVTSQQHKWKMSGGRGGICSCLGGLFCSCVSPLTAMLLPLIFEPVR